MTATPTRLGRAAAVAAAALLATGCSLDSILKSDDLPPTVTDPAITRTPAGALAAYHGLASDFRTMFASGRPRVNVVAVTGLLTDELRAGGNDGGRIFVPVDGRAMIEGEEDEILDGLYSVLQRVRGQASQAIGLLADFAPEQRAVRGHAYVLQAYAEIFLAESFCSGIPLSTLDYDGDYTLRPGSTSEEVYRHALALLDTAATLVVDSARYVHLERIARARALLGLDDLAGAAAAVAAVPTGFSFAVSYGTAESAVNFARVAGVWELSVADREGDNGLPFRADGDPRTASRQRGASSSGFAIFHPDKYAIDGGSAVVLASGVEARLIEAEARLAAGDPTWLDVLNALRATAIAPALAPLADPGTADARVDLVFAERARWLFLTGQRQAALRRLVRQYGRDEATVYPAGYYEVTGGAGYGADVSAPVPATERALNRLYAGCISRDA